MPAVRVRRATLDDLDLLVRHRRRMFEEMRKAPAADLDRHDRAYRRWARARLRTGTLAGFVASAGKSVAGSGCVWMQPIQPHPHFAAERRPYLLSMWTEPAHRGRGVATRIVEAAIRFSRGQGARRLALHASDAGRRVYAPLGFAPTTEMSLDLTRSRATRRRG